MLLGAGCHIEQRSLAAIRIPYQSHIYYMPLSMISRACGNIRPETPDDATAIDPSDTASSGLTFTTSTKSASERVATPRSPIMLYLMGPCSGAWSRTFTAWPRTKPISITRLRNAPCPSTLTTIPVSPVRNCDNFYSISISFSICKFANNSYYKQGRRIPCSRYF